VFFAANPLTPNTGAAMTLSRSTVASVVLAPDAIERSAYAGELRLHGWRRVSNLLSKCTAGFNNSDLTTGAAISTDGYIGQNGCTKDSAQQFTLVNTSGSRLQVSFPAGTLKYTETITVSVDLKSALQTSVGITCNNGAAWSTFSADAVLAITSQWKRYSLTGVLTYSDGSIHLLIGNATKDGASGTTYQGIYNIRNVQIERVSGISIQTPGEETSVGSLSSPYWGVGVDGISVKDTANGNTVASNVVTDATGARFDPTALVAGLLPGVLIEPQATNLCTRSEIDSGWTTSGGTLTVNNVASPNGATTGCLFTESAGTGEHDQIGTTATVSTGDVTFHVAVKAGTRRYVQVYLSGGGGGWAGVTVDTTAACAIVATGQTGTSTYVSSSVAALANGWYLVSVHTQSGVTSRSVQLSGQDTAVFNITPSSSGSKTWYTAMAQITQGTVDSSHIVTTSGTVTRSADVISGATASTVYADSGKLEIVYCPSNAAAQYLWGSYTDASNWTRLYYDGTQFIFEARIAGTTVQSTYTVAVTAGTQYTVVGQWSTSTITVTVNTVSGTPAAISSNIVLASTHQIGADGNSAGQHGGTHQSTKIWRRAA
jgi:hypothetical protein